MIEETVLFWGNNQRKQPWVNHHGKMSYLSKRNCSIDQRKKTKPDDYFCILLGSLTYRREGGFHIYYNN